MKPYSLDLRQRVLAAVDEGQQTRGQIAQRFAVSTSWIRRLVQRRRATASIAPRPQRRGPAPKRDEPRLARLRELVGRQPDATLAELRDRLAEPVSLMTVCRALRRLRLPLKKVRAGRRAGPAGHSAAARRARRRGRAPAAGPADLRR
jgi:transposase